MNQDVAGVTRPTVLVVDDTVDNLSLMVEVLNDKYLVKVANSGERALELAALVPHPDLILLDIMMPGMNGYEVCQRLKKNPQTQEIPVIFLTSKSEIDDEKKGLEIGAVDYITKPISPSIVLARVHIHLTLKAQTDYLRDKSRFMEIEVATERKKTEKELRELRDHLQTILDAIPDLLFEIGLDGRVHHYHASRAELLAAAPDVFLGKLIREFLPEAATQTCMAALQEAHAKGWSTGNTYSLDLPQGTTWFELSVAAMDTSETTQPRFILLSRDITDRINAQEALRESESRWRFAIEGTGDALWDWDMAGNTMFFSERWKHMLGLAPDEIGTDPQECERYLHRDDKAQVLAALQAHWSGTTRQFKCEYRMLHKDGATIWILGRGLVVRRDAMGLPQRMIGTNSDITERKNAAAKLQVLSRRILEVQEGERRRIAHELHDELGQTLTAVKINLQSQRRNDRRSPQESAAENVRMVDSALQQMRQMALTLRPSVLDDLGLASALDWLGEQVATRSDLQVSVQADMKNERLSGDIETACFRIVQEALTNIQRHAFAKRVKIDLRCDGTTLQLTVSDDGCGFTPEDSAVGERSMGLLGMQERASLIGGCIAIESSPGRGCRIRLECSSRKPTEVQT